jgi:hypothetical protein
MADNAFGLYGIRKKESSNAEMARLRAGEAPGISPPMR